MQPLTKAVNTAYDLFEDTVGIEAFLALYSMLGKIELYDGICSAMEDAGYDEEYYTIIDYYEEYQEA